MAVLGAIIYLVLLLRGSKKSEPDQSVLMLDQRINDQSKYVGQQLNELAKQVNQQMEYSRQSSERATQTVGQQVHGFVQGMTQLQESLKNVQESVKNVVSFQDIFKNPKLRGMWGEQSLENALGQYFPKEMYEIQHYFKSGEAVDAVIKLPNSLILPIDAKFNWDNFVKMIEAEDDISKDNYRKQFLADVKTKVDEIASKYILPSENTTDYALMYVPAEAVYYEIINNVKGVDIPTYARSRKIGIMSPNTLYLTTAAILHWFKNIEFNNQTRDIMKRLERITADGKKLGEEFGRLGKHISNAASSYNDTEKRLTLMVDRVKNVVEIGESEQERIESPKV